MLLLGDCLEILKSLETNSVDSLVTDPPAGISFMGKDWDHDKGGRKQWIAWMTEVMTECMRVMKPGAHGLVWALPRTSHWTATALEDAGFEVRDVVTHLFGSGFPKSLDISKAIDKAAGAERKVVSTRIKNTGTHYYENGAKMGAANYGVKQNDSKIVYEDKEIPITAPCTDLAKQWQGWGTALKPASEHWILVRNPCSEKTVAANVLKHGTGGLNIDKCRIPGQFESGWSKSGSKASEKLSMSGANYDRDPKPDNAKGRFPANLVLDEAAEEYLGESARYFYCAKASKSDRGEDNNHPTVKSTKLISYLCELVTPPGGTILDPFMGSGSTGKAAKQLGFEFIGIEQNQEYFEIAKRRI